MNRNSGIGLLVFGIVLVVVGAIMRYAVSAHASGFSVHKAGVILLLVGIGIVVVSLLIVALGGRSRSTTRTDVRATPQAKSGPISRTTGVRPDEEDAGVVDTNDTDALISAAKTRQ